MANKELGIKPMRDGSVQYPARDTFCDGMNIVRNPKWLKSDYVDLFEEEGLELVKPHAITSNNLDPILKLLKSKYFCKMRDSGGALDADLCRRLKRIAIKIFNSYPADMI